MEELDLSQPYAEVLAAELRAYSFKIVAEVTLLALRSALHLGKPDQFNHTHLFSYPFEYQRDKELIRFKFIGADVVPFQLGLASTLPNPGLSNIWRGLPTLQNVDLQKKQKNENSAAVAVSYRAVDPKYDEPVMIGQFLSPRSALALSGVVNPLLPWSAPTKSSSSVLSSTFPPVT